VQLFYRAIALTPPGLKALGIASDSDLPANAKFEHSDDEGWISGDSAAITGLYARLPSPGLDEGMEGTRRFLHELNRFGITGVFDPGGHNLALRRVMSYELRVLSSEDPQNHALERSEGCQGWLMQLSCGS